ncbi:MAG TPA: Clp protease N-terminal domain-containing protein [Actinomycetota bacterium]|nr:Clp protease N-terminal domain-containing protein [Actinomycetota bacterium]
MFETFAPDLKGTVMRAREKAVQTGANSLEAEHLLLSLAEFPNGAAGRVMANLGLNEARIQSALDEEFEAALARVGVTLPPLAKLPPRRRERTPQWGQSAKVCLKRTQKEAVMRGDRKINNEHLLIGIAHTQIGAIPGVLKVLGMSPGEISLAVAKELKKGS